VCLPLLRFSCLQQFDSDDEAGDGDKGADEPAHKKSRLGEGGGSGGGGGKGKTSEWDRPARSGGDGPAEVRKTGLEGFKKSAMTPWRQQGGSSGGGGGGGGGGAVSAGAGGQNRAARRAAGAK
jgi:hypothetical protein